MKELTVSLIIPAYNEEKYIGRCLEYAIKNSNGLLLEILVIDNASTDKTHEVAEAYPGVTVISENQKGLTRARQCGYKNAHGDILAYIDADTRMPEGWIQSIINEFKKEQKLVCVSGPYIYYDISKFNQYMVKTWNVLAVLLYKIVGYMVTGGNFAIKKEVLNKLNGFDTSIEFYGEDTNIARRAHTFGKVKFTLGFYMYTSGRRFKNQGIYSTGYIYFKNFLSEVLHHRPLTREYRDFR